MREQTKTTVENNSKNIYIGRAGLSPVTSASFGGSLTPTPVQPEQAASPPPTPPPPKEPSRWRQKSFLRLVKRTAAAVIVLGLIGGSLLVFGKQPGQSNNAILGDQFRPVQIPLDDLKAQGGNLVGTRNLTVNGGFIISPSSQPNNGTPGQIYYDQGSNQLAYYNGTNFVPVAPGVLSLQGQTGNVTFSAGPGVAINGTTLSNTGVTSVGGQSGAIGLGGGLGIANGTLRNTGLINAAAGTNIVVTNDGAGNITISSTAAGGTVQSPGGTAGRIAKFSGVQTIADSLLSESGTTVTVGGDLGVTGGLTLGTALGVSNGGTGATSLANNGVVVGQGSGALTAITAAGPGLCLVSTAGAPAFAACPGGSGVTSLDGLNGVLILADSSGAGSTITINDASTAQKGIAQFNGTNFSAAGGTINTIQNINTAATPTFGGVNTNTITPSGALTVGATGLAFTLQGTAGSVINATSGASTTTLAFQAPTANATYRFATATAGTYDVCTTTGNCAGVGGGVTGTGTNNRLSKFTTTGGTIGDSTITDNGTTVTTSVNLVVQGGTATVGVANSQTGTLKLADGGTAFLGSLVQGTLTSNRTYTLPDLDGTVCLSSGNCTGSGSGSTLQAAYDAGNSIITSDARDVNVTLANTAADANFNITAATGGTGFVAITRADGVGAADPAQLLLVKNNDTDRAQPVGIAIQSATGGLTTAIDASGSNITNALKAGANTITGTTGNITYTNFNFVGSNGNLTTSGDIAVNGGDITSSGALNITPGGTLTVGVASQTLSLVGGASTSLAATSGANTNSLVFAAPATTSHTITIPNASGTICLQSAASCGFATGSGEAFVQGGNSFTGTATFGTNDNFGINIRTNGATVGSVSNTGAVTFTNASNSTSALDVQNTSGASGSVLKVDTSNNRVGVNLGSSAPGSTLEVNGTLRLSGSTTENFTTPQGSAVPTKINIPTFDPGAFGQILAFGLTNSAQSTARGLSLFDGRTSAHQPTLALFSPDEGNIVGLTWNGSNAQANVQTMDLTAGSNTRAISLQSGSVAGGTGNSGAVYLQSGSIAGGSGSTSGDIIVQSGTGGGTNASSGNIDIDTGTATGSGTVGQIYIGLSNTTAVHIGHTAGTDNTTNTIKGLSIFQPNTDSATNLVVNDAGGNQLFAVGGTGGTQQTQLGANGTFTGRLQFNGGGALNTNTITLVGQASPGANRTITLPDETGTVCLQSSSNCGFALSSGNSNYIQNQNASPQTSSNFYISGTGEAATALWAPSLDSISGGLSIGNANATSITLGKSSSNIATTIRGTAVVKPTSGNDSATALQVQNGGGTDTMLAVDTTARSVSGGNLVKIGNSTGTDTALTVLQLDAATADPTSNLAALNGGMFYNSTTNKVSLIENGQVKIICNTTDLGCGTGTVTLQSAYGNGSTISTSGNDIGFTLNSSQSFTVATAAGATGSTVFSLTDGSNATPPAQLVLVKNNDTNQALTTGISVQSAAGGITTAFDASGSNITNALAIGAHAITGTNFSVSAAGVITLAGGQTKDITTADASTATGLTLQPGTSTAANGTGSNTVLGGGDANSTSCGTACTGGNLTVQGGSATGASGTTRNGGNLTLNAGTGATANGTLTVGSLTTTNTINIGNATTATSNTQTVNIATSATGTGRAAVTIGNGNDGSSLLLQSGTGNLQLTTQGTGTLGIGNNAVAQTLAIGNGTGATAVTIASGTGNLQLTTQGTGILGVGNNAVAQTIQVGNGTGATAVAVSCGTGVCGFGNNATDHSTTLGSTTGTSTGLLQSGSGGLNLTSGGNITLGTSDTTGTQLVLDTKTGSGDPSGVNGGMYYNSNSNTFRCYENGVWYDCLSRHKIVLGSDVASSTGSCTNNVNVTGLSFAVTSGNIYRFHAMIYFTTDSSAAGGEWTATGPANTYLLMSMRSNTSASPGLGAEWYQLQDGSDSGDCTVSSTGGNNLANLDGIIKPTANGTLQIRMATSSNTHTLTAKAGSTLEWW